MYQYNKGGNKVNYIMATQIFIKNIDVVEKKLGKETILYNIETGKIHVLNLIATTIWALCDGKNSTEEIVRIISSKFKEKEEIVIADIYDAVNEFLKHQLIKKDV